MVNIARKYHKETTPLSMLPPDIYYLNRYKFHDIINGFKCFIITAEGKRTQKSFSINKYTIEMAYKNVIKTIYGEDKLDDVLKEFPIPNIHPSNLSKSKNKSTVYGVNLIIGPRYHNSEGYLSGLLSTARTNQRGYFSIAKFGLEEAWKKAIEHRYSFNKPMPGDNTELPKEYWDLINPKYKTINK